MVKGCQTSASTQRAQTEDTLAHLTTLTVLKMLVVVVEWSIVLGREDEFLRYWSKRETVADLSGLIGEFLTRVRDADEISFVSWQRRTDCSTFLNVGIWRDCTSFIEQIGPKLIVNGQALTFEHEPRRRIFLGPERWRLGESFLPTARHPDVL